MSAGVWSMQGSVAGDDAVDFELHIEKLVRQWQRHRIGVFEVRRATIVYDPPRYDAN